MRVLTIGDSFTQAGQWQAELSRLVAGHAGVTFDVVNAGLGTARTTWWPDRIGPLLAAHQPDLVTFITGINDDVAELRYGEPATSWAWRSTVEAIHAFRSPAILVVPAWIQYSDPLLAPQWLLDSEPTTNDRIYEQWARYASTPGWFTGVADFQQIPATASFLDDVGIHPNGRGYRAMGRIVYDAIHADMGWPQCTEPPLCDMYGHRRGYPRPAYITCTCGGAQ